MSRSFYFTSFERSERGKNGGTRCPGVFIFPALVYKALENVNEAKDNRYKKDNSLFFAKPV